jgi:hypothetical protein
MAKGVSRPALRPESPEFEERSFELPEEFKGLIPVQGRRKKALSRVGFFLFAETLRAWVRQIKNGP